MSEVSQESKTPDPFANIGAILHKIIDILPLRFEREVEIFHSAIDKIATATDDLFAPVAVIPAAGGGPDTSALEKEVQDLKAMVSQLVAAQQNAVVWAGVEPASVETAVKTPVTPAPDPVPVPAPVITPGA